MDGLACPDCQKSEWTTAEFELCNWCGHYILIEEIGQHLDQERNERAAAEPQLSAQKQVGKPSRSTLVHSRAVVEYNPEDALSYGIICGLVGACIAMMRGATDTNILMAAIVAGFIGSPLLAVMNGRRPNT